MTADPKATLKYVWGKIKEFRVITLIGTILLILTNWIGIVIPISIKDLVDNLSHNPNHHNFWLSIISVICLALVMAIIRTGSRITIFGIGRRVESGEKQLFFEHLLRLDLVYFSTQRIGDLISRATSDIQAIRQMMGFGLLNIINIVWIYAFTLPLMFSLNAQLTICVLAGYVPVFWFVKRLSSRLKTLQQKSQEELGNLSSFIQEDLSGIQVIQAYSQAEREIKRFNLINENYRQVSVELAKWRSLIWPAMGLARGISLVILVSFVASGKLSTGTVAAFVICLERLVFPTAIMGWLITIFQKGSISVGRIQEIYIEKPKILSGDKTHLKIPINRICVQSLKLGYSHGEDLVLRDLSLEIKTGQFVGIVGLIGSGKSTLASALVRILDIPSKSIFFDQTDITEIPLTELRDQIMLVPQETYLFNASIYDNLSFGGHYEKEEVLKAARICQIDQEIQCLPAGYETPVGDREVSLSGGQAQRVALVRAILKKPSVLLLDDALSSVDNEVGAKILQGLKAAFPTLILITHRLSALKEADLVYVLHAGKCVGMGTHHDLLMKSQIYQKLWQEQSMHEPASIKTLSKPVSL